MTISHKVITSMPHFVVDLAEVGETPVALTTLTTVDDVDPRELLKSIHASNVEDNVEVTFNTDDETVVSVPLDGVTLNFAIPYHEVGEYLDADELVDYYEDILLRSLDDIEIAIEHQLVGLE